MKKFLTFIISVLIIGLLTTPVQVQAAKKKVKLERTRVYLDVKEQTTIQLLNNTKNVTWSVNKKGILKIKKKNNQQITIQGKKKGTVTLKAKTSNKTYTCNITVDDYYDRITMYAGTTKELYIAAHNSKGQLGKYSCSNKKIAKIRKVTKNYVKVSALKPGTTFITMKLHPFTRTYKLEVIPELTEKEIQEWSDRIKQEFVKAFTSYGLEYRPNDYAMTYGGVKCRAKTYKRLAQEGAAQAVHLGYTSCFNIKIIYQGEGIFMVLQFIG